MTGQDTATARFVPTHTGWKRRRLMAISILCAIVGVLGLGYVLEHWTDPAVQANMLDTVAWIAFCIGLIDIGFAGVHYLAADGSIVITRTQPDGQVVQSQPDSTPRRRLPAPAVTMPLPPRIITKTVVEEVPVFEERVIYRTKPPELEQTDVYRLYDPSKRLLYVGISNQVDDRLKQHADTKPWWGDVERADVRRYPFRYQALAVEHGAIMFERPKHNIRRGGLRDHGSDVGWPEPRRIEVDLPAPRQRISPERTTSAPLPAQRDTGAEAGPLPREPT